VRYPPTELAFAIITLHEQVIGCHPYRHGEPIATGFVESTVNEVVSKRFCKKQQMQWSKEGVHLLLQTRVRTLNGALAGIFRRWYPDLDIKAEEIPMAA